MKRWQKPIIAFVALKLNLAIFSYWTGICLFVIIDGDATPHAIAERTGKPINTAAQCYNKRGPERIIIKVGKGWLQKHLTPKQFADYAIERITKC